MTVTTLAVHPAAELFPMMTGDEFDELVADIRANGQHEPVILTADGTLLDGRNRYRACVALGIEPRSRVYAGDDPLAFVLSANLHRRHLNTGQKALLALAVESYYAAEAKRRQAHGQTAPGRTLVADLPQASPQDRKSRTQAAKAVGTSGRAVSQAKRVSIEAPDLVEKVASGDLALDRAERILRDRKAEERRVVEARSQREHQEQGTTASILQGDFREVLADLRDVDAIITDPPYPKEYLPLLRDLGEWASKVLAPDGLVAVLMGQTYLPDVYAMLSESLSYRWTMAYLTPGPGYASHSAKVQSNWKPVLVFGSASRRFADVVTSSGTDAGAKDLHHWGQDYGAFHTLVERLTAPGQTVVDPFAGSGTTLLAAQALGRHAIGAEIDPEHIETARRRLS